MPDNAKFFVASMSKPRGSGKLSPMKRITTIALSFLLSSCTVSDPVTTGSVGGLLGGMAVGGVVGGTSKSVSLAQGIGYGALIGVPAGIALAYTSDAVARLDTVADRSARVRDNALEIRENDRAIERSRQAVLADSPQGLPDEGMEDRLYLGPTIGNRYR